MNIVHPILLLIFFATSCNGQVKTNLTTGNPTGQTKLVKTQGTGPYDNVHCGLQDKDGILWFGTTGEGLYRYDGKSFINYTIKDGLSSNSVGCIYEDKDGNLWIGTGDDVCIYNPPAPPYGKAGFTAFRIPGALDLNPQTNKLLYNYTDKKKSVSSILQDKTGNFWFGTDEGVFRYNPSAQKAGEKLLSHTFYNDSVIRKSGLRLNVIQAILEDKSGNIWFASWEREGVCRFDGKSITSLTPNGDDMVHSILEDKSRNIWFGTRNHGACRYNPVTGEFTSFADVPIFSTCCVYAMAEDKSGNIWFGTELGNGGEGTIGGVWCYNPSADGESLLTGSKGLTNFTTKDGLSHNSVFSVTADKSGEYYGSAPGPWACAVSMERHLLTFRNRIRMFLTLLI